MWTFKNTTAILALVLACTFVAIAQTSGEDLDPRVQLIILSSEEIGPGFRTDTSSVQRLESNDGETSTFLLQTYYSANYPHTDGLSDVTIRYGVFDSDDALLRAWNKVNRSNAIGIYDPDLTYGDVCLPTLYGNYVRFVKDHAIVEMSVTVNESNATLKKELQREIRDELAAKVSNKIETLNLSSIRNFDPSFSVLSDTPFQAILSSETAAFFEYNIFDLATGDSVKLEPSRAFVGEQEIASPDDLQPGSYQLFIRVFDDFHRFKTFAHGFTVTQHQQQPISLVASGDAIISQRFQHQNDGASVLLTVEKVQGKAARSVLAFDLNNTNINGLSRATLVMTIDPSQPVNGWGNGRTISAQALTTPWQEGNGWSFGLKKKDQIAGNGSGATWFSPTDQDISNDSANSAVNWDGATSSIYPPTAPSVQIANFQTGEVAFDVTTDVLNGAENGWLILKDQENVGSKISFYSREGAAAAGNPDLAPRLILEFGDPVASGASPSDGFLAKAGLGSIGTKIRATQNGGELRSVREVLQENPVAALATEQLLYEATRTNPVLNIAARTAYRSWLAEDLRIAAVPVRFT